MSQVAETILNQLGGNKFRAMTGAYSFASSDNTLSFRLPAKTTKNRISGVIIKLEPSDTYTITFLAMRGFEVITVKECKDVYADMLTDVFETVTGLLTLL
jgi:hypothetical protein